MNQIKIQIPDGQQIDLEKSSLENGIIFFKPIKNKLPISGDGLRVTKGGYDTYDVVEKQHRYFFTSEELNEYTQNVIKQALETAAEKAETEYCGNPYNYEDNSQSVNKQSITNTFEETFKKFEV